MNNNLPSQLERTIPPFLLTTTEEHGLTAKDNCTEALLDELQRCNELDDRTINIIDYLPIDPTLFVKVLEAVKKNLSAIELKFSTKNCAKFDSYFEQLAILLREDISAKNIMTFRAGALSKDFFNSLIGINQLVHTIRLCGSELNEDNDSNKIRGFIESFFDSQTAIQEIQIYKLNMEAFHADTFKALFNFSKSLTSLFIRKCSLQNEQLALISSSLAENTKLTKLAFESCDAWSRDKKITELVHGLKQNSTLTKLKLSQCDLGNSAAKALIELFKEDSKTAISCIDLSANFINEKGYRHIAAIVQLRGDSLQKLNLFANENIGCNTSMIAEKLLTRQTPFFINIATKEDQKETMENDSYHADFETYLLWLKVIAHNPFFEIRINKVKTSELTKEEDENFIKIVKLFKLYQKVNYQIRQVLNVKFISPAHLNCIHKLLTMKENAEQQEMLEHSELVTNPTYCFSPPSLLELSQAWFHEQLATQKDHKIQQQLLEQLNNLTEELQISLKPEPNGPYQFKFFTKQALVAAANLDNNAESNQLYNNICKAEKLNRDRVARQRWGQLVQQAKKPISELVPEQKRLAYDH